MGRFDARQIRRLRLLAIGLVVLVLVLDQALKIWVKTHMVLGEDIPMLGEWARLHFLENNGIAFGLQLSGWWGKLLISLLRLGLVGVLIYFGHRLLRSRHFPVGVLVGLSLVVAGALGNIIDGTFYGLLFSASGPGLPYAEFLPAGGGYAPLFFGKVVDMFYFPLFSFVWPDWVPGLGGESFTFFSPVFNLADAAITCGIFYLILFKGRYLFSRQELGPHQGKSNKESHHNQEQV